MVDCQFIVCDLNCPALLGRNMDVLRDADKLPFIACTMTFCLDQVIIFTGLKQTWEIGSFSMKTRRYVGNVHEFPQTKRRKYPQYTSE